MSLLQLLSEQSVAHSTLFGMSRGDGNFRPNNYKLCSKFRFSGTDKVTEKYIFLTCILQKQITTLPDDMLVWGYLHNLNQRKKAFYIHPKINFLRRENISCVCQKRLLKIWKTENRIWACFAIGYLCCKEKKT